MTKYDSTYDTKEHIRHVGHFLKNYFFEIANRSRNHDASKLEEPEKSMYDEFTPKLRAMTYGSDEYKASLKEMGVALKHHYENNSHHPEHFKNGINGMSLVDILEMLADWQAACLRHDDGDIYKSLKINKKRFEISDQLYEILQNSIDKTFWKK